MQRLPLRLAAAFALALIATAAHAFPGAEAIEVCFKNHNRGGNMSFYLYPAHPNYGKRIGAKVWEYKRQSALDPPRCASTSDLVGHPLVQRGALVAYYTAEGKVGKAHFRCGPVLLKKDGPVQRVIYNIHGTTIYNSRCEREIRTAGRFPHPEGDGAAAASVICFENDHAHRFAVWRLLRANPSRVVWMHPGAVGAPQRCVRFDEIKGIAPGTELTAQIDVPNDKGGYSIPCRATVRGDWRAPAGVESYAVFTLAGGRNLTDTARCERTNYITRK